jgi:prephenate dehydrogenase
MQKKEARQKNLPELIKESTLDEKYKKELDEMIFRMAEEIGTCTPEDWHEIAAENQSMIEGFEYILDKLRGVRSLLMTCQPDSKRMLN